MRTHQEVRYEHPYSLPVSAPGAAEQPQTRTNSHFRDEKERWILRLNIQNTVHERLCYNHAARTDPSTIDWANLKFWLSLCNNDDWAWLHHERCVGNERHLCRFLKSCDHKVDGDRRIINDGTPFRCIDVETGELVEMYLTDHYLALSYVWG
jgi:hypothetical protein